MSRFTAAAGAGPWLLPGLGGKWEPNLLLATGHGNADVGGSQAPLARHQPGPGPGLQISPDLPDWCTVVPYAGQGRTAG